MSKIATYSLADSPLQLSDRLIGTEAPRPTPSSTPLATKNFSLGELLQLFSSNFPAPGLQGVLDTSNTATQDINLSGTIFVDLIKPTNIEDMLNSIGTPLQILSKGVGGICWIDAPSTGSAIWGDITGDITNQTDLINYLSDEYYPLNSNPAGYLVSDDLSGYATESWVGSNFYPLSSNPAGYITQDNVEEYPDLASFPTTGAIGTVYIALDTDLLYVWNGTSYTLTSPVQTGITGLGRTNFIPIWTSPTTLGSSLIRQVANIVYVNGTTAPSIGNTTFSIQRPSGQSQIDFSIGNPLIPQQTIMQSTNDAGFDINSRGYLSLKAGLTYIEGLRVLGTGQIQLTQTPETGTTSDKLLVRDASGNVKQIDYPIGGGIPHGTASGTDTYTAAITGVTAYADGDAYLIRFTNGNTTGSTLNINGIGAVALYRNNDGPLLGGDILDGGEMICVYNSTTTVFQCIGTSPNSLYAYVKNDDSVTLTKGMPVYAFSGTGDRMTVKRANNTGDATSAQTVGLVMSSSIAAGQKGLIMVQGLLDGLSILPTSTWADGDPVYLGATDGTITNVKPYAPNHLVYLGVVTTASNGSAGRMYVRVQNGYELQELHNVQITSTPANNDILTYEASSSLYKMKSLGTILGYNSYRYVNATRATYLASVIGVAEYTVAQTTIIGGTFSTTDVMKMLTRFSKPAGAGSVTLRVRINTTNTLVGATQIALLTLAGANTTSLLTRTFNLSGATLYGYNFASSLALDLIATNTIQSSTAYTTTNDLYVFFTVQIANAADSITFELANITN